MGEPRCLLDACVLYPTVMREILLGAGQAGLISVSWSARILEEWRRAAARQCAHVALQAEGEIAQLSVDFPEALLPAPKPAPDLWLPDPNDIHVLASAREFGCVQIVTMNLRDFPKRILGGSGITAVHPDAFMTALWVDSPEAVEGVVTRVVGVARRLSGEAWTTRKLLRKARLPTLGRRLESAPGGGG